MHSGAVSYTHLKDLLTSLALAFQDPEVGAVMGRVIPYNVDTNMLTRLLNLARSGGYQADQQARYNLRTLPQYGGLSLIHICRVKRNKAKVFIGTV